MRNIDKTYFCPHTLEFFFNLTECDNNFFCFVYSFKTIYCRVNRIMLSCYFECQDLIVNKHNSHVSCFKDIFQRKI